MLETATIQSCTFYLLLLKSSTLENVWRTGTLCEHHHIDKVTYWLFATFVSFMILKATPPLLNRDLLNSSCIEATRKKKVLLLQNFSQGYKITWQKYCCNLGFCCDNLSNLWNVQCQEAGVNTSTHLCFHCVA
jgi:hypothetical protein